MGGLAELVVLHPADDLAIIRRVSAVFTADLLQFRCSASEWNVLGLSCLHVHRSDVLEDDLRQNALPLFYSLHC